MMFIKKINFALLAIIGTLFFNVNVTTAQTVKVKKGKKVEIDGKEVLTVAKKVVPGGFNLVYKTTDNKPFIFANHYDQPVNNNGNVSDVSYYLVKIIGTEYRYEVRADLSSTPARYIIRSLVDYGVMNSNLEIDPELMKSYIEVQGGCCNFTNRVNININGGNVKVMD
ncbi:MAG: hypothetical protein MK212_04430 [Saprospiraceae bacterium]|nr:hypothetical protein [Saprospiraceae bacterium]